MTKTAPSSAPSGGRSFEYFVHFSLAADSRSEKSAEYISQFVICPSSAVVPRVLPKDISLSTSDILSPEIFVRSWSAVLHASGNDSVASRFLHSDKNFKSESSSDDARIFKSGSTGQQQHSSCVCITENIMQTFSSRFTRRLSAFAA